MTRRRIGGFIFVTYVGDHLPLHVHIEASNGEEIGRWNIEKQAPMDAFQVTARLRRALIMAGYLIDREAPPDDLA
jgi:hypothetical protein